LACVRSEECGVLRKASVVGVFVVFLAVFGVVLVFSAEAVSALASVNVAGVVAAVFAAVVGFEWLKKNIK
jgi:hypothetical protein